MKPAQRQVVVDLGPGLFLTSDGQFLNTKPAGAVSIMVSSVALPLSGNAKTLLHGQSLETMGDKKLGTKVLDGLGISEDFRGAVTGAVEVASSVVSVVGWIGTAMKLAQALGIFGPAARTELDDIKDKVDAIYDVVSALAKQDAIRFIVEARGKLDSAMKDLKEALQKSSFDANDLERLKNNLANLVRPAWYNLVQGEVQKLPFDPSEYQDYAKTPWYYGGPPSWTLVQATPAGLLRSILPASQPSPSFQLIQRGQSRWDYRMFLPAVIQAINIQLAHYVAIDPLFRTTGQFRDELSGMRDNLADFAGNMLNCIQWTQDYDLFYDKWAWPMAYGWPVGAVDICSGASSFIPKWNEGVISIPPTPGELSVDPFAAPRVTNVEDSLMRAADQREQNFLAVFLQSGIPEMLILIANIDEQTKVPMTSETVHMGVRKLGARKKVGTAKRTVEPSSVCVARDFPADVYHFPREFIVSATRQPLLYAGESVHFAIPYHYYLESYSGDGLTLLDPKLALTRTQLENNRGTVELQASCFDWEMEDLLIAHSVMGTAASSSSLRQFARSVLDPASPTRSYPGLVDPKAIFDWEKMQWGDDPDKPGTATHRRIAPIHLDYDIEITQEGDQTTIRLRNHPEDGSFERVYLVVEEVPGPAQANLPPIRTSLDISMIGLEYHLPSEYFGYRGDCLNKAAALLDKIHQLAQVSQVPIPRWDPYQSVGDYVKAVQQEHPELLKGIAGLHGFK